MKKKMLTVLFAVLFLLAGTSCHQEGPVTVENLKTEWQDSPRGLDTPAPRLSWQLAAGVNHVTQEAYRIMAAGSQEDLASGENLLWDSGKVESDRSHLIPYEGAPLQSGQTLYWKVKAWTNKGTTSWSDAGHWTMALLKADDWQASWIGLDSLTHEGEQLEDVVYTRLSARYLRKEFSLEGDVRKATLYISGLGMYECYLNGEKVSRDVFAPSATGYDKYVYYNTYDVTSMLKAPDNAIGVVLGNGRYFALRTKTDTRYGVPPTKHYGFPKLLMQLEVEYAGGGRETIVSDTSWRLTTDGPIVANNEFDGEEYNAHLELPGWNRTGFDDAPWMNARTVEAPAGRLMAQPNPNIQTMEEITPVAVNEVNGKYIVDMGQNMVGWLAVTLRGKKDQPVTMRFGEAVNDDGSLYTANLRGAKATNIYTPSADGTFSWCPSFTYHGFRYAEISGIDYKPKPEDFTGKVNYDRMQMVGSFESSSETINQIYRNALWGIKGNYRSFPTDCPQRDERMAWLGDRATGCFGESFMFGHTLLYEKWLRDIEGSQKPSGSLPDVAPAYWPFYSDNITWPSVFIHVANMLYEQRGDVRPVRQHYDAMKHWLDHMEANYLKEGIMTKDVYGDWCMPPESPELIHSQDPARKTEGPLLATSFYYRLLHIMSKFAVISNHPDDAPAFKAQAEKVKQAYNERFYNPEKGWYANNTVTANLVSLMQGLVPEEYHERVFRNTAEKIETVHDSHVGVGLIGIQFLMRGLDAYGRSDLSLEIANQRTYPSWGYMIENGATTIWELWNGNTADPAMNSRNHVMLLGDFLIWCYENLAGIRTDPEAVGFKKIRMQPGFHEGLDFVNAHTESPYGKISSSWSRTENGLSWKIGIPPNSSALVTVPAAAADQVLVNDGEPGKQEGFVVEERGEKHLTLTVPSGNYQIEVHKGAGTTN